MAVDQDNIFIPSGDLGGGGGGTVDSVNGQTGDVVLDADDISAGTTNKYVTATEKTVLSNTSGTNTGDQTLSGLGGVPTTRTINGYDLSANRTLTKSDVGLGNVDNTSNATERAATATLTNKTLTSPVINTPTGIVKGDVGLGNVDNTSNATERAASATLTNKTISGSNNTLSNIANSSLTNNSVTIGSTSVALGATAATLAGLTLTTPTIASFANANHNHTNSAGGGQLGVAALSATGTPSSSTFLRGDNTWGTPAGAGDMAKATYDPANIGQQVVGTTASQALTNKDLSSSTNTLPSGLVIQNVGTNYSAVATGTTTIPNDDTIPQNTEGDEYMSQSITPKSTTNVLEIEAIISASHSSNVANIAAALFQDSTANALAATQIYQDVATGPNNIILRHRVAAGTTSATTFKIRIGGTAAGTLTFNGQSGARFFGAITKSSITVREIKA